MPQNHLSLPLLIAVAFALLVVGLLLLIAHACQTHVLSSCTLKQFLKCEYFKYDWRPSSTNPCYLRQIMWSLFLGPLSQATRLIFVNLIAFPKTNWILLSAGSASIFNKQGSSMHRIDSWWKMQRGIKGSNPLRRSGSISPSTKQPRKAIRFWKDHLNMCCVLAATKF